MTSGNSGGYIRASNTGEPSPPSSPRRGRRTRCCPTAAGNPGKLVPGATQTASGRSTPHVAARSTSLAAGLSELDGRWCREVQCTSADWSRSAHQ